MEELLNWARCSGITDASSSSSSSSSCIGYSLAIASFPQAGGRGLAAARDLKEGELILRVPQTALLSVESAKEDVHFMKAVQLFPQLSSVQVLVALLLREIGKGASSRWFAYLRTLPRSYQTLVQFSSFETQALQAEDAIWTAEWAIETSYKEWMATKPLLQMLGLKGHLVTLKAWKWACSTVSSRTLHVPWSSAGTMCPVGDLFNYGPPGVLVESVTDETFCCNLSEVHVEKAVIREQTGSVAMQGPQGNEFEFEAGGDLHFTDRLTDGGYDPSARAYLFYARKDYKKGDQVLLCYGLYTNLELLEHYGFILPQNPNDKVFLRLDSFNDFATDLVPIKPNQHGSMHIEVDGRPSFQLLAALRLYCAPAEVRKHRGHLALCGQRLSMENDLVVYQKLKEACTNLIGKFPSTILMDSVLLHILSLCSSLDGLVGLLDLFGSSKLFHGLGQKLLVDSVCGWSALGANDQEQALNELQNFCASHNVSARNAASRRECDLQVQRWWLSINWRFCQKRIIHRCIIHCDRQLLFLKRQTET